MNIHAYEENYDYIAHRDADGFGDGWCYVFTDRQNPYAETGCGDGDPYGDCINVTDCEDLDYHIINSDHSIACFNYPREIPTFLIIT